MTLRQRLALHYGAVVLVALLLLGGLVYHEFATEKRLREMLPPDRQHEAEWGERAEIVAYAMIPVILLAGWWLTRRSLRPLSELTKTVEHVTVQNLRQTLPRTGNADEVDRLTAAFNTMAARLDESFQQVREFTLHASHELKTPLTVMRGALETAMAGEETYTAQQRECLHSLIGEVERLTKIVDALTLLTKAETGQLQLQREPVRLAELVRESFEDAQILAEPHGVAVTLGECREATVLGDRHRLRQLLLNLVDNAVKYNCANGSVTLALRRVDASAEIEITNTGDGIPPAMQARVFDRFVRGDNARAKAEDGCGLGLTIAQWIAQAHGGTIQLSSGPGKTTATVRLPVAPASTPSLDDSL